MACALTRRFSNSSFTIHHRFVYSTNLLSAGLSSFLTFTLRVSLSLNFLSSIYIRVCLFLSLSLILLVISRLVCFSKTVDIVFFLSTVVYVGGVRISLERIDHASFQRDCG